MKQYNTPSLRVADLSLEQSFLASAGGENADPRPGTWFLDDDEIDL